MARKGIGIELEATYTPAQNGAAERSGGVLTAKARALRIHANLPETLWPESIKAAAYLTNRSPSKSLEWSTPFEKFYRALNKPNPRPNLVHLRVYGCRAYAYIPQELRARKAKLAERAHIGFLVGYDSTNIFCIWLPSNGIVISTCDVTFNESLRYDPRTQQLDEAIREHIDDIVDSISIDESLDPVVSRQFPFSNFLLLVIPLLLHLSLVTKKVETKD